MINFSIVNLCQSDFVMGKVHKWPAVEGPPIGVARLALMLTTFGQQILFLIQHDILSSTGICYKCNCVITGAWIEKTNARYCDMIFIKFLVFTLPEMNHQICFLEKVG